MQTDLFTINFSAADDTDTADFIFFSACDKDLGEAPLKIRVIRVILRLENKYTHKFPFTAYAFAG